MNNEKPRSARRIAMMLADFFLGATVALKVSLFTEPQGLALELPAFDWTAATGSTFFIIFSESRKIPSA
jgi:hypothetical protein